MIKIAATLLASYVKDSVFTKKEAFIHAVSQDSELYNLMKHLSSAANPVSLNFCLDRTAEMWR